MLRAIAIAILGNLYFIVSLAHILSIPHETRREL